MNSLDGSFYSYYRHSILCFWKLPEFYIIRICCSGQWNLISILIWISISCFIVHSILRFFFLFLSHILILAYALLTVTSCSSGICAVCFQHCICLFCSKQEDLGEVCLSYLGTCQSNKLYQLTPIFYSFFSFGIMQGTSSYSFHCSWKCFPCCFWQSPVTWYVLVWFKVSITM